MWMNQHTRFSFATPNPREGRVSCKHNTARVACDVKQHCGACEHVRARTPFL